MIIMEREYIRKALTGLVLIGSIVSGPGCVNVDVYDANGRKLPRSFDQLVDDSKREYRPNGAPWNYGDVENVTVGGSFP